MAQLKVDVNVTADIAEILRRLGFEQGTTYMPVPRCDGCRFWVQGGIVKTYPQASGRCTQLHMWTKPDFGCVKWEVKNGKPEDED